MFKSMMLAGLVALGAVAIAPAAEARTDFNLYFGIPFYGHQVEPDWEYSEGYGWYDAGRYGDCDRYRRRHDNAADFEPHFGVPFYSYRVGPGWR